jgi:4,5-DOPA dioxygenase extradiol
MNAIEDNEFSRTWANMAANLPKPRAILCVSAHWLTEESKVTAMAKPKTIHDFGGFPRELYAVEYPALGDPALAVETVDALLPTKTKLDIEWGLDHGTWSVLRRVYPAADVPIVQLGIDYSQGARYHYEMGCRLKVLRERGVLVIGSGNLVHNLAKIAWDKMNEDDYAYDWAREMNDTFKSLVAEKKDEQLIDYEKFGKNGRLAIPTPDHYFPFLYILGARDKDEPYTVFNDKAFAGSLTMTSFTFG